MQDDLVDESPDSPDVPDDLPYVTLKRCVNKNSKVVVSKLVGIVVKTTNVV